MPTCGVIVVLVSVLTAGCKHDMEMKAVISSTRLYGDPEKDPPISP